jgi:nucleotide-binding universal stress UspA family protein
VFDVAVMMASRFRAALWPFRAVLVPPEFPPAAAGSQRDPLPAHLSVEAMEALRALRPGKPLVDLREPVVRIGVPWRCMLEVAEELDIDLIVMGSHGYHGIDRLVRTTADRVADRARCNVLIVHAPPVAHEAPATSPYR